jgi:hypothetical protein
MRVDSYQTYQQEWRNSLIPDSIFELNVQSVGGETALEILTEVAIAQMQSVTSYITGPVRRFLDRYDPIVEGGGGWWVTGVDPLNHWERMEWGQLKPNTPRSKPDQPGSILKYESPAKVPTRLILLDVDEAIANAVYQRYGINPDEGDRAIGFWHCVWKYNLPVVIVEGAKKAGCLLGIGFAAIALPGIWNGIRTKDALGNPINPYLIPDPQVFATSERTVTFAFDADEKLTTQRDVARPTHRTAHLFAQHHCQVQVASWVSLWGKGIDDVAARRGLACVEALIVHAHEWEPQSSLANIRQLNAKVRQAKQQQQWRDRDQELAHQAWLKAKTFTPTIVVDQPFVTLDPQTLLNADIHALKSGMGTGKTQALATLLKQTHQGAIAIGCRNSLLLQSCECWGGFYHLHEDNAFALVPDRYARIACCLNSILHFRDSDFDGKILILDEVLSTIKYGLFSGILADKRSEYLAKFEQAIKRAAVVIAWDGNHCDIAINYLHCLRGEDARIVKQLNAFQTPPLQVELIQSVNAEGKVKVRDYSALTHKLQESLASLSLLPEGSARAVVVISDSQTWCESLDNLLSEAGYRTLRIDSKTILEPSIKDMLKAPDAHLKEHPIEVLILSPTAENGVDISIKNYFTKGFAYFFGVIDTDAQMQFLRRTRHCLDWAAWCIPSTLQPQSRRQSPFARQIERELIAYVQLDAIKALEGHAIDPNEWDQCFESNPHLQTYFQLAAARNYERMHTRDCLKEALEQAGHHVMVVTLDPNAAVDAQGKAAKEAVIAAEANSIFQAQTIPLEAAIRIKSSFGASLADRAAAEKALLLARLPGLDTTDLWSSELVERLLFRERGLLLQLERYWLLQHLDEAQQRVAQRWQQILSQQTFLPDVHSDFALLQALKTLAITDLFNAEDPISADDPRIVAIHQQCQCRPSLQTAIGQKPGRITARDWVGRLMRIIGGRSVRVALPRQGKTRPMGYHYLAPDTDPVKAALLMCIDRRFQSAQTVSPDTDLREAIAMSIVDHPFSESVYLNEEGDPQVTAEFAMEVQGQLQEWWNQENAAIRQWMRERFSQELLGWALEEGAEAS